jgi:hypothetical protein
MKIAVAVLMINNSNPNEDNSVLIFRAVYSR